MKKDEKKPENNEDRKVRAERFYEDEPDAFVIVKPKKQDDKQRNKK
jgi:hypothetical protein